MRRVQGLIVFATLAAIAAGIYYQTSGFGFVFDDDFLILDSPPLREGLSARTILWAWGSRDFGNWFPLTRLSFLLDATLFGLRAGPMHLMNALLHLATAWTAFRVLSSATGMRWRSAAVASLYAAHPLQVESVAWVSERSMLLAGLLFWATLGAYVRYVRRPAAGRYLLVFLYLLLGLLAKPILATLPVLLLLLDWWPLGRIGAPAAGGEWSYQRSRSLPLREKAPLLLLCAAIGILAIQTQVAGGAVPALSAIPLATRVGNALRGTAWYLEKIAWPSGLGVYYPLPATAAPLWHTAGAAVLLGAVSVVVLARHRRQPCLLAGWLWFTLILIPVSGIVQAGAQATADRYMYLPLAGILLAVVWAIPGTGRHPRRGVTLLAAGAAAVVALALVAHVQTNFWRDNRTLFRRAVDVAGDESPVIQVRLAMVSLAEGDLQGAARHYRESLRMLPNSAYSEYHLGRVLARQGQVLEAIDHYRAAIAIYPKHAEIHRNLGAALEHEGRSTEALQAYLGAIRADARDVEALDGLARLLAAQGRQQAAEVCASEAGRLRPALLASGREQLPGSGTQSAAPLQRAPGDKP